MPATKVTLAGGGFQDAAGNVLANGKLIFRLSQDSSVSGVGQVAAEVDITVLLDGSGNVQASPPQLIWGNDQLLPINTFYKVTGYSATGQLAYGPNNQQVIGNGGTFDLGTWVPNQVISWVPLITIGSQSQSTVGAAGAASALPATPSGYLPINVSGTVYVIPFYLAS